MPLFSWGAGRRAVASLVGRSSTAGGAFGHVDLVAQGVEQRGDLREGLATGGEDPLAALADEPTAGERSQPLDKLGVVASPQTHQPAVDIHLEPTLGPGGVLLAAGDAGAHNYRTRTSTGRLSADRKPRRSSPTTRARRRYTPRCAYEGK